MGLERGAVEVGRVPRQRSCDTDATFHVQVANVHVVGRLVQTHDARQQTARDVAHGVAAGVKLEFSCRARVPLWSGRHAGCPSIGWSQWAGKRCGEHVDKEMSDVPRADLMETPAKEEAFVGSVFQRVLKALPRSWSGGRRWMLVDSLDEAMNEGGSAIVRALGLAARTGAIPDLAGCACDEPTRGGRAGCRARSQRGHD